MNQDVPIYCMPHEVVFVDFDNDDERQDDRLVIVRGRDLDSKTLSIDINKRFYGLIIFTSN